MVADSTWPACAGQAARSNITWKFLLDHFDKLIFNWSYGIVVLLLLLLYEVPSPLAFFLSLDKRFLGTPVSLTLSTTFIQQRPYRTSLSSVSVFCPRKESSLCGILLYQYHDEWPVICLGQLSQDLFVLNKMNSMNYFLFWSIIVIGCWPRSLGLKNNLFYVYSDINNHSHSTYLSCFLLLFLFTLQKIIKTARKCQYR